MAHQIRKNINHYSGITKMNKPMFILNKKALSVFVGQSTGGNSNSELGNFFTSTFRGTGLHRQRALELLITSKSISVKGCV